MQDPLRGLRILVVEDEYLVATDMERVLSGLGAEVVGPVGHLGDAQRLGRQEPLHGAILDVDLAGEAVYPLAEELARRKVPMILATGIDVSGVPREYECLPNLQKPFDDRSLQSMVEQVFRRA